VWPTDPLALARTLELRPFTDAEREQYAIPADDARAPARLPARDQ